MAASLADSSAGRAKVSLIHDFGMARFMLGEGPVKLGAYGSALVAPEVAEVPSTASVQVLERWSVGRLRGTPDQRPGGALRLQVLTRGRAVMMNARPRIAARAAAARKSVEVFPGMYCMNEERNWPAKSAMAR